MRDLGFMFAVMFSVVRSISFLMSIEDIPELDGVNSLNCDEENK